MSDRIPYEETSAYILLNVPLSSLNKCEEEYVMKYRSVRITLSVLSSEKESILNEMHSTNNTHCSTYRLLSNNLSRIDETIDFLSWHTLQNLENTEVLQTVICRERNKKEKRKWFW